MNTCILVGQLAKPTFYHWEQRTTYLGTTPVMEFDMEFGFIPNIENVGWYFHRIVNDTVDVDLYFTHSYNISYDESYRFLRVK